MKTRLYPADFRVARIDNGGYSYFSYEAADFEICIEPTGEGFDIGYYDHNGILIDKRQQACFDDDRGSATACFDKAVEIANEFYRQYLGVTA